MRTYQEIVTDNIRMYDNKTILIIGILNSCGFVEGWIKKGEVWTDDEIHGLSLVPELLLTKDINEAQKFRINTDEDVREIYKLDDEGNVEGSTNYDDFFQYELSLVDIVVASLEDCKVKNYIEEINS